MMQPVAGANPPDTTSISKSAYRKKMRSRKNRQRQRQRANEELGHAPHRESIKKARQKHVKPMKFEQTTYSIKKTDMASTGYVGLRRKKPKKVYTLQELQDMGFTLKEWDGK
jgi:hypothetical protein